MIFHFITFAIDFVIYWYYFHILFSAFSFHYLLSSFSIFISLSSMAFSSCRHAYAFFAAFAATLLQPLHFLRLSACIWFIIFIEFLQMIDFSSHFLLIFHTFPQIFRLADTLRLSWYISTFSLAGADIFADGQRIYRADTRPRSFLCFTRWDSQVIY